MSNNGTHPQWSPWRHRWERQEGCRSAEALLPLLWHSKPCFVGVGPARGDQREGGRQEGRGGTLGRQLGNPEAVVSPRGGRNPVGVGDGGGATRGSCRSSGNPGAGRNPVGIEGRVLWDTPTMNALGLRGVVNNGTHPQCLFLALSPCRRAGGLNGRNFGEQRAGGLQSGNS